MDIVLAVNHHTNNLVLLSSQLIRLDYPTLAVGFPQAVEIAERLEPCLIVVDYASAEDHDNFQIVRYLKSIPCCRLTPLIVLSTLLSATHRQAALNAGAVEFIPKPYTVESLRFALKTHWPPVTPDHMQP